MDPWEDYLALPVAPFVLFLQTGTLFLPRAWMRWSASLACTAAIWAMLEYVESLELRPEEGVNIGAGLLAAELALSILLLGMLVVREIVVAAIRWRRSRPGVSERP